MKIQLHVLQQLTCWTLGNPDRIRERMEEQKDSEQTYWVWHLQLILGQHSDNFVSALNHSDGIQMTEHISFLMTIDFTDKQMLLQPFPRRRPRRTRRKLGQEDAQVNAKDV